ncbi:unnamed protein product [Prunus armeniaca]
MPPRKKTKSNTMASQDGPDHGDSESRQNASSRGREHASEGAFTLTDLITAMQAMGETQMEIMDTIKELKNAASKPSEDDRHPQEESAAAGKGSKQKGPSFVTQKDVVAMLEKELSQSQEVMKHQPLFFSMGGKEAQMNMSTDSLMLWGHTPVIIIFDSENSQRASLIGLIHGTPHWHQALCVPGMIWQAHEERVTTTQLNNTRQKQGEDPVDFVRRFRDLALDCYDEKDEEALVKICINNIIADYRVYLENIGISQFSWLLEAVRKTSIQNDKPSNDYSARKRKDRETYPPLPCKDEEFHAILDTMIADGVIKPRRPYKVPTREEKSDPRYCRYHQFVGHPTTACQSLRRILHGKIHEGVLELPSRKQTIDEDPLLKPRGKETAAVITCLDDLLDDDELCNPWRNHPKPPEAIWEPCGNMDKAYWCKYSKPSSYDTPWSLADGWDGCADNGVFMLDMPEEQCQGASSGQQETAAVTFHTLTEAEATVME